MPQIKQPLILAGNLSGVVSPVNGGTGQSSYTIGDLLVAGSTTTLDKLPDVGAGAVLVSGGIGAKPVWSTSPTVSGQFGANGGLNLKNTIGSNLIFLGNASTARYTLFLNGTETGSNAGSDLIIGAFSDVGGYLGNYITITRSNGAIGVGSLLATGGIQSSNSFTVSLPLSPTYNMIATGNPTNQKFWRFFINSAGLFTMQSLNDAGNTSQGGVGIQVVGGVVTQMYGLVDNVTKLGFSGARWTEVFAVAGTINTSDAREKKWLGPLSAPELAVAKRLAQNIGMYQWLSALEQKGDAARLHAGVLAQDVQAAFEAEGLDAHRYGMFTYDEWEATADHTEYVKDEDGKDTDEVAMTTPGMAAGNRYGVRYSELTAFVLAGQEQRLAALETTLLSRVRGWWAKLRGTTSA